MCVAHGTVDFLHMCMIPLHVLQTPLKLLEYGRQLGVWRVEQGRVRGRGSPQANVVGTIAWFSGVVWIL